ncbi:hypothetical protein [Naasia aerilata]|uniref:Uncharacterized protein n=1 Tax=Naasia aerilata TaxID=1162966 RepID=A0ABN6XS19_9MICO|nr:hypothetical protein [Naasia aerilata]BDZ47664.1 hypothetical protein GCM10025866_35730 [Naasia aerilata]
MELGALALRYVPFLAMLAVATIVILDARVRVKRPGRARWSAPVQLLLALAMLVLATVAIIVSPEVGLLDAAGRSATTLTGTLFAFAGTGAVALLTLVCGLAWPASPHPRRGLTVWALLVDALAVAMTALQAVG